MKFVLFAIDWNDVEDSFIDLFKPWRKREGSPKSRFGNHVILIGIRTFYHAWTPLPSNLQ